MSAARDRSDDRRPLIAHVVHRFGIGGLENGVVNLVNGLPRDAYRHAIVAYTEVTSLRERILHPDVEYVSLRKAPGQGFRLFPALYRTFRRLAPSVVHTRNLGALEASLPAWLAGVPVRIHGEHGWDVGDLDGSNRAYRAVRRAYRPFVHRYVALSRDLERYLVDRVAIPPARIAQVYNGVDTQRFSPAESMRTPVDWPFAPGDWVVGTVGRLQTVKDQTMLAEAYVRACAQAGTGHRLRLAIVGSGPLREPILAALDAAGLRGRAWLPGEREDVPQILRALDCFVLPSLAEGVSNTLLEAMATGLPVIATRVGGNAELVTDGVSGRLVAPADPDGLAQAILAGRGDPQAARALGRAARADVLERFSLERMLRDYHALYRREIERRLAPEARANTVTVGQTPRRS